MNTMKLILVATKSGKEFYIKTDLDTDIAILKFELETKENVRHYNDDYCGDANEATHYDYLYLSTDVVDNTQENAYDDSYYDYLYEQRIPCKCCGGSGYI